MSPIGLHLTTVPHGLINVVGGVARTVVPDGGQRVARRNARQAMIADRERAAGRREAALAYLTSSGTGAPIAR